MAVRYLILRCGVGAAPGNAEPLILRGLEAGTALSAGGSQAQPTPPPQIIRSITRHPYRPRR